MTPLQRLARGILERMAGTFSEGPAAPARLAEMVAHFADSNPHATRGEWAAFAAGHAAECYRSGYARGQEDAERDWRGPEVSPEETADELDPGWRGSPPVSLAGEVVLERNDEAALADAEARAYLSAVARSRRGP